MTSYLRLIIKHQDWLVRNSAETRSPFAKIRAIYGTFNFQ